MCIFKSIIYLVQNGYWHIYNYNNVQAWKCDYIYKGYFFIELIMRNQSKIKFKENT